MTALNPGGKYASVNCLCLRASITDILYRVIILCRLIVRALNGVNSGAADMIPDVRETLLLASRCTRGNTLGMRAQRLVSAIVFECEVIQNEPSEMGWTCRYLPDRDPKKGMSKTLLPKAEYTVCGILIRCRRNRLSSLYSLWSPLLHASSSST